ncbi:hypothetical protein QFC21_007180 [Naganishia friedmannii]|uniref:Uncharacterized protein n=1 Tax=Naganishia friedmannii TaxID=89922 RepID=A0ACC2UWW5_9TREE|nr:hypothetical protein QFC21_007180 [Naganishia friedmannii]
MRQNSNPVRSVTELREFTIQDIIDGRDSVRLAPTSDDHLDASASTSVHPAMTIERELVLLRGEECGAFLTGSSPHNQRIERSWRHLREAVIDEFTANFYDMEERGLLNPEDALHLYYLHEFFLPLLQDFLDGFVKAYNRHAQTFVNANRNGFAFDHYPNQEEEAREWYEQVYEDGEVDAGHYNPDNVRYPVPPRHVDDPHGHVDRFTDSLPELLFRPTFRRELERRSGRYLFDTAGDVYVNILAYLKGRLRAQQQREQSLGA